MKNHDDFEGMVAYYPLLIETAIEFKVYAKILLAKYISKISFTIYIFGNIFLKNSNPKLSQHRKMFNYQNFKQEYCRIFTLLYCKM